MNKKILFCATVDVHFKAFHLPYLQWFKQHGWEVHVAALGNEKLPFVDKKFDIPIQRSPISKSNISAYKKLKSIIESNKYQIIHCHTPVGGVLTRLAARYSRRQGTKVIYTAHGFHFCKGAPILNWIFYYPVERFLAHFTDCLITINREDFDLARNRNFKAMEIKHVHGVGVNMDRFYPVNIFNKLVLRAEYNYKPEDFLLFYAGEFNRNKNQQFLIKSISLLKEEIPNIKLLLAGDGPLLEDSKKLAIQLGVDGMVDFLGYRNDIDSYLKMSDLGVSASYREGLPVNIMEAMACGLPIIASKNRGHRELILDEKNGYLFDLHDQKMFTDKIKLLAHNAELRTNFGRSGREIIENQYSISKVLKEKRDIYHIYMDEVEEYSWAVH